jgi:hypothetical protein
VLIRPLPGQRAGARHRGEPARQPAPAPKRSFGATTVVGGTVWIVLAITAVVAALGGMFTPTGPTHASTSTLHRAIDPAKFPEPPAASGHGRRVVFDQSEQRVWLVASDGDTERSYLVTGSRYDNLRPGTYQVNSRNRVARTYGGGGTFEYFVKFAEGRTSAIGFHAVTKLNDGRFVYARDDLGTARTPGCVEALPNDAKALWEFAPVGTPVVVKA